MAESNPMRWLVLGVIAAAVFTLGILTLVQSRVDAAKAEAAAAVRASEAQVARADEQMTAALERAAAVAGPFVADIGAQRFDQAYRRMAQSYRAVVSPEAFAERCQATPLLLGARGVVLRRLRTQIAGGASTLEAEGVLDSRAGAVPASFVFLQEEGSPRILVFSLAGDPVVSGAVPAR